MRYQRTNSPDRGNVEPNATRIRQGANGTPLAVVAIVGGSLLFLIAIRRAFNGAVVTY